MARTTNAGSRQTASRNVKPAAADVATTPLAALSRTASAVVRATGDAQQQIAARTGLLQKEAALKLRHAVTPGEVVAVQTALFVAGWQHSLQCSQDLARVWLAMGSGPRVH